LSLIEPAMQWAIEMIIMRQLASHLATPIIVIDTQGDLVYYNEPAERILGRRFDEVGTLSRAQWLDSVRAVQEDGSVMAPGDRALLKAVDQNEPSHARLRIQGLDGVSRQVEGIAFPMVGQSGRKLGAVAVFWEIEES
jgi:PAS domain-containing protein